MLLKMKLLSGLKVKNYLKINILIIEHIKMYIKSLEIKTKTNYNWDDIVYINNKKRIKN